MRASSLESRALDGTIPPQRPTSQDRPRVSGVVVVDDGDDDEDDEDADEERPPFPPLSPLCRTASTALAFSLKSLALVAAGAEFRGMSSSVVTPPAAAAALAVSSPSQRSLPGSLACTCTSMTPGPTIVSRLKTSTVLSFRPVARVAARARLVDAAAGESGWTRAIFPSEETTTEREFYFYFLPVQVEKKMRASINSIQKLFDSDKRKNKLGTHLQPDRLHLGAQRARQQ